MIKVAIIGCGGIGTYHLGHLLGFSDVDLVGFCDLILEKAQSFAEKAGQGKCFTDYKQMLDDVNPEIVFVCIPPTCHGEIENKLIDKKIPFFVEKPVSLDLKLAKQIRDRIKQIGLITASGFQCRYSNLVAPNIDFIRNHEIVYVDCSRMGSMPETSWWKEKALSGGQIVEQTIHQFDIIRYVFGEPEEVFTYGTRGFVKDVEGYNTDDLSTTVVKFKNGALGTISTGCYLASGAAFDSKVIFGAKDCRAELKILHSLKIFGLQPKQDDQQKDGFVIKGDGGMIADNSGEILYKQDGDAGILCDRTFIDAVISGDGSKIRSPYEDAVKSLTFTLACNESMDTGKPVKICLD